MQRATRRILRTSCPFPVGDLRSPKWRAARYVRPFPLRRRTWVEANLFIRSFLPDGNTYRTFRAPFVKRVAGRTLTAHSNVLRIYVARFPAFPPPSLQPPHTPLLLFHPPSNSPLVLPLRPPGPRSLSLPTFRPAIPVSRVESHPYAVPFNEPFL